MNKNMYLPRIIEFVFTLPSIVEKSSSFFSLGLFKVDEIISITEIDKQFCLLTLSNNKEYKIYGTSRAIHNRYLYTIEKLHEFYHDPIIRPSSFIYHHPLRLDIDNIFMDKGQLKAFFMAVDPSLLNSPAIEEKFNFNE